MRSFEQKESSPLAEAETEMADKLRAALKSAGATHLLQEIRKGAEAFQFLTGQSISEFTSKVDGLGEISEEDALIEELLNILRPALEVKLHDPELYAKWEARRRAEGGSVVKVNDLLAYNLDRYGGISLHVYPSYEMADSTKAHLLKDGLMKLANVLEAYPSVDKISATSWIVAAYPSLLRRLGFEVDGPIDEETKERDFEDEERPVSTAHISRENLLKLYGTGL